MLSCRKKDLATAPQYSLVAPQPKASEKSSINTSLLGSRLRAFHRA